MKEGEYCQTIKAECTPRNCPVEFCKWRDTVWAIEQMRKWAYTTNIEPKTNPPQTTDSLKGEKPSK